MVTLAEIIKTKKSSFDIESPILFTGIYLNKNLTPKQKMLDAEFDGALSSAITLEGFEGKAKKELQIYGNDTVKRVVVIGLGENKDYGTDEARAIASNISRYAQKLEAESFTIDGESFGLKKLPYAQAFTEGLALGTYEFNTYKTKEKDDVKVTSATITGDIDKKSLDKGLIIGQSVGFARDLSNHPANVLTPTYLAKEAKKVADNSPKMEYTVFDVKEFKKMGMGAFLGVAQGAKEPAKMILVEYKGGKKSQKPIALVGKGLTFDSGGISIKPAGKMDEMKFDMCGSATVMGVLKAVAELKPKLNIVFAIGSTENMPDGNAQRPGDIVTAYNGKTIEVLNTDAEGRLVLADVLSYVNAHYEPEAILDFATLTGAVLIALGNIASGVMGNDDTLMKEVKKASQTSGEKVWELPLWKEYCRAIKGKYADIQNLGEPRLAGTIAAGAFLKEFVNDTPWVHLDIAGTAWGPKEPTYHPKVGATGVGVRMVYQFLENRK
ncbi:MAG: leucyl aminopeptidase [Candidatus Marinimicrobia bacterium]|jgi:leucyl aminopeptidase|nr:leucyl aminopeptidase [Candidatus Neomarinimicrobiota bacterium]MDP6937015.1 leucyl aminopeptidase [Candidatus Neomarinimicrobiota bacterium]